MALSAGSPVLVDRSESAEQLKRGELKRQKKKHFASKKLVKFEIGTSAFKNTKLKNTHAKTYFIPIPMNGRERFSADDELNRFETN